MHSPVLQAKILINHDVHGRLNLIELAERRLYDVGSICRVPDKPMVVLAQPHISKHVSCLSFSALLTATTIISTCRLLL
jgi:hypothetical protein